MPAASKRQSRRIAQRRNGETEALGSAATRYASENFSPDEVHRAQLAMILSGLAFLGAGVAYVVVAAGQVFG
jgi:hypothetical protein